MAINQLQGPDSDLTLMWRWQIFGVLSSSLNLLMIWRVLLKMTTRGSDCWLMIVQILFLTPVTSVSGEESIDLMKSSVVVHIIVTSCISRLSFVSRSITLLHPHSIFTWDYWMVFKSFKVVTFEQVLGFDDGDSEGCEWWHRECLFYIQTFQTVVEVNLKD